jgi:hypothetical protein
MPALIASGTNDVYSSTFTLGTGDTATVNITTPTDPEIPETVEAVVQMQSSASTYIPVSKLNKANPRLVLNSPGTYRVYRRASAAGFGVDYVVGAASTRTSTTASIANGASVTGTIDLTTTALLGFTAPAAWTAAALNIEVSPDNATWYTAGLIDGYGASVGSWSAVTAGAGYSVDAAAMLPWRYIRLRSGTAAAPVNQGAQRDFTIITRPLA